MYLIEIQLNMINQSNYLIFINVITYINRVQLPLYPSPVGGIFNVAHQAVERCAEGTHILDQREQYNHYVHQWTIKVSVVLRCLVLTAW